MYLSPIHLRNQTSNMTLWIKTSGLQGLLQQFYGIYLPQCGGGGKVGGKKGSKLPISHSLNCQCPPHSYWLSSLCTFSITRYYKVIHNFYPVCLGSHHLPIFSSSAFHTPPPPLPSPILQGPCSVPDMCVEKQYASGPCRLSLSRFLWHEVTKNISISPCMAC